MNVPRISESKSGLHFLIILYFVFKKALKLGVMVICFLTIYLMSSLFLTVKGKPKSLYCIIEGVPLFAPYLFFLWSMRVTTSKNLVLWMIGFMQFFYNLSSLGNFYSFSVDIIVWLFLVGSYTFCRYTLCTYYYFNFYFKYFYF